MERSRGWNGVSGLVEISTFIGILLFFVFVRESFCFCFLVFFVRVCGL